MDCISIAVGAAIVIISIPIAIALGMWLILQVMAIEDREQARRTERLQKKIREL